MKIFVKILAVVLAMLLLVAFVACKSNDEQKETDTAQTSDVVDSGAADDADDSSDEAADDDGDDDGDGDGTSDTTPSEPVDTFEISIGTDNGSGWEDYNDIK